MCFGRNNLLPRIKIEFPHHIRIEISREFTEDGRGRYIQIIDLILGFEVRNKGTALPAIIAGEHPIALLKGGHESAGIRKAISHGDVRNGRARGQQLAHGVVKANVGVVLGKGDAGLLTEEA